MDMQALSLPVSGSALDGRVAALQRKKHAEQDGEVAREVEGLFAQLFVKELRRGLGEGFFGQGAGSDTFEGWLDEHLGASLARDGVLDLAGRIRTSLEQKRAGALATEGPVDPSAHDPARSGAEGAVQ
jgi:Rod binding domain-containing protein